MVQYTKPVLLKLILLPSVILAFVKPQIYYFLLMGFNPMLETSEQREACQNLSELTDFNCFAQLRVRA